MRHDHVGNAVSHLLTRTAGWACWPSQAAVALLWWHRGWGWGCWRCCCRMRCSWSRCFAARAAVCAGAGAVTRPRAACLADHRRWPVRRHPAILDLLDAYDAKATFFVVGARAQQRPELVRDMVRCGHGIGNHSHTHPQAWFWALGPRRMAQEIGQAQRVLACITGQAPRLYRSVVGMTNPFVASQLRAHGLTRVAWSARGFDGVRCEPDTTIARIVRDLQPGAIVLLHEGAARPQPHHPARRAGRDAGARIGGAAAGLRAANNTSRAAVRWARTARSQPQWTPGTCRFRAPAAPACWLHRRFVSRSARNHENDRAQCKAGAADVGWWHVPSVHASSFAPSIASRRLLVRGTRRR